LKRSRKGDATGMTEPLRKMPHIPVLDGWRGISILLVLLGHLFPLGPKGWQMNAAFAAAGMAVFFCLSGFLITNTLIYRPAVGEFLIRRLCRIVPLSWAFMLIVLLCEHARFKVFLAQMLFVANYPPFFLTPPTAHLWSLCVEVQFYLTVALLYVLFRHRGLYLLPLLCVIVTGIRIATHTEISIVTYARVDEILAGATLALALESSRFTAVKSSLKQRWLILLFIPLAVASAHPLSGPLGYLRPYIVTLMVGQTVLFAQGLVGRVLRSRTLFFLAEISYALYVLHPLVDVGWLNTGPKIVRYIKRMPALAVVFAGAWASTRYYEHWWIAQGKRWSRRLEAAPVVPARDSSAADVRERALP
jgi:peptidoglycan/LPS O-acetylase OafA/YrhL